MQLMLPAKDSEATQVGDGRGGRSGWLSLDLSLLPSPKPSGDCEVFVVLGHTQVILRELSWSALPSDLPTSSGGSANIACPFCVCVISTWYTTCIGVFCPESMVCLELRIFRLCSLCRCVRLHYLVGEHALLGCAFYPVKW